MHNSIHFSVTFGNQEVLLPTIPERYHRVQTMELQEVSNFLARQSTLFQKGGQGKASYIPALPGTRHRREIKILGKQGSREAIHSNEEDNLSSNLQID